MKLSPSKSNIKQNQSVPIEAGKEEGVVRNLLDKMTKLTDIGLAWSAARNMDTLLEMIMEEALNFSYADGGTLYILEKNKLHFKIFRNDTLGVRMGGNDEASIPFPPLDMEPSNISSHPALTGSTINISDISEHKDHDFLESIKFDKKFNYHTQSMLLVPMKNKNGEILGVIQLLNARKPGEPKKAIPFSNESERLIQSLASQAAVAIDHVSLLNETRKAYSEVASARDIAMDANAAKTKFLANVTHELRTPMNAIIGYTEILLEETRGKNLVEIHDDLGKIGSSAKLLLQLINEILDLSKIEAGKMEVYLDSFKIQEITQSAIHSIEPMLINNNNTLKLLCGENLGYMVADMNRVRQTLINLLSNANKFTENGEIRLEVKRIKKEGTPWVVFKVTDTGIGIPKDKLRTIFSEFTQAESSINRKFGGTGLGLAISQRFCRMMGGSITVDSEVDKGSTFTVEIPAKVIPFIQPQRRRSTDIA